MSDNALLVNILKSLEIAILKRVGPRQYEFLGDAPAFYQAFFPFTQAGPCANPWEYSPMLEFFLDDAEEFFEQGEAGQLVSGVWQEDDKTDADSALMAMALCLDGEQVIIIRILYEDYRQRAGILRKARQQLLDNRHLASRLELFKAKSRYDGLTKVFNRTTFMEILQDKLDAIMKKSQSGKIIQEPPSLLMMDIDDFKKVNDSYGHLCGDIVLRTLGELLQNSLRKTDVVARYGGEEFIVLISRGTIEQAFRIGEKIREQVEKREFSCVPQVTISMGCTSYILGEGLEDFLNRADKALYEAKHRGKNNVCIH